MSTVGSPGVDSVIRAPGVRKETGWSRGSGGSGESSRVDNPRDMTETRIELLHKELTGSIISAFYEAYNELRYGFLEAIYAEAMARLLRKRGHSVEREVMAHVWFQGDIIGVQRLDMIVDEKVVIEIKSTHDLALAAHRQLLSYLRGTGLELGLLLHFGPEAKFHRIISTVRPDSRIGGAPLDPPDPRVPPRDAVPDAVTAPIVPD
jgi:GxxExxY protein